MNKLFLTVLTVVMFCTSTGHAYVRDYSKIVQLWKSESNNAYVFGKTTFDDDTEVINLFVVSFDKEYGCKPVFKISFLDGYEYGKQLKTIPIQAGFLKLYVDNKLIYDGPVVHIVYSNGDEFGAAMSPEMLKAITEGEIVQIELVDKMDILFNLNDSRQHIGSAQKSCSQQ